MTDRALVVGCDAYPKLPDGDLTTAVDDALAIHGWLLGHGGLTEEDVVLLVSPIEGGTRPNPTAVHGAAELRPFVDAVIELVDRRDVGPEDRLFVFFAGHGCRTDPHNAALSQDALAFSDFDPKWPQGACVEVPTLVRLLEQSRFGAVVLLLDACRNFPFDRPIRLGGLGFDHAVDPQRLSAPRARVGQATIPGGMATGQVSGPERGGEFTRAVVEGLSGEGAAKVFNETADPPYTVTWNSLADYVRARVPDATMPGEELVLARYADGWFPTVRMEVGIAPQVAATATDLRITVSYPDPAADEDGEEMRTGPAPITVDVPPRRHRVAASSGTHRGKAWFDVYDDQRVTVTLREGGQPVVAVPPPDRIVRGLVTDGLLTAVSIDPTAVVEVREPGGTLVARGIGKVRRSLPPRWYVVRALEPDGPDAVAHVDVEPGLVSAVELHPTPTLDPRFAPLDVSGELRWASAAAAAVLAALADGAPSDASVLAVAVPATSRVWIYAPVELPRRVTIDVRDGTDVDLIWTPYWPGRQLSIVLDDHLVGVPSMEGALVGLALTPRELEVSLFDRAAAHDVPTLLAQDRAQRYLAAQRPESAGIVLSGRGVPGPVDETLRVLVEGAHPRNTVGERAQPFDGLKGEEQIGRGPWRVTLDENWGS